MGDGSNPYESPDIDIDYKTLRGIQRRKRRIENIILGTGVALFAFILIWLPGIVRVLMQIMFGS